MDDELDIITIDPADLVESSDFSVQVDTPPADTEPKADNPEQQGTQDEKPVETKEEKPTGKTFSQAEVDAVVEKRLAREKAAHEKAIKENPALQNLERIAQRNGLTTDALLAALEKQAVTQMAEEQGISVEAAERIVKAEAKAAEADAVIAAQQAQSKQQEADRKEFADFVAAYPEIPPDKIPPEVWADRDTGKKTLLAAYKDHETKALKQELETLKQQLANKQRAPITGGVGSHGTVAIENEDPFLAGFDSV